MMIGSKYLIFVDEAGSPTGYDPKFPAFVLSFVIISKKEYAKNLLPKFCELKLKYFNHTHIVFHERNIRKAEGDFEILTKQDVRDKFMQDINVLIADTKFSIIASITQKNNGRFKNLYEIDAVKILSKISKFLKNKDNGQSKTPIIFESRGKKEDKILKTALESSKHANEFEFLFSNKSSNGFGIQLADLTARPIGVKHNIFKFNQQNRAFDIISEKLDTIIINSYHNNIIPEPE